MKTFKQHCTTAAVSLTLALAVVGAANARDTHRTGHSPAMMSNHVHCHPDRNKCPAAVRLAHTRAEQSTAVEAGESMRLCRRATAIGKGSRRRC